jgi:predicted CDP-diglyceride synthetase/phosphatidate cytidylyltransferase
MYSSFAAATLIVLGVLISVLGFLGGGVLSPVERKLAR